MFSERCHIIWWIAYDFCWDSCLVKNTFWPSICFAFRVYELATVFCFLEVRIESWLSRISILRAWGKIKTSRTLSPGSKVLEIEYLNIYD